MFNKLKLLLGITNFKANAVLKDGTELVIQGDIAVGVTVSIVTADGNKPLPDGTFELDNGSLITVVEGKITEIKEPDPKQDAPVVDKPADKPVEPPTKAEEQPKLSVEEALVYLEERITKLEQIVSLMNTENKDLQNKKEELTEQIKGFEEKLSKMDGAIPLKKHITVVDEEVFKLSPIATSRAKALGLKK
jgi:hypothetical protein